MAAVGFRFRLTLDLHLALRFSSAWYFPHTAPTKIGIPIAHPSFTISHTSSSRTSSKAPAQPAEIQEYLDVLALVLCRSARPSQVAIHVSKTVMEKTAAQSRTVRTHAAINRFKRVVSRLQSSGIAYPHRTWVREIGMTCSLNWRAIS